MFTPTHFVDTDPTEAGHNRVENGELLQELGARPCEPCKTLVDFLRPDGTEVTLYAHRVRPLVANKTQVTCRWLSSPHNYMSDCSGVTVGYQRGWDDVRVAPSHLNNPLRPEPEPAPVRDEFTWPVGSIVRRPDQGKAALYMIEQRVVDVEHWPTPTTWDDGPYRLLPLSEDLVPEEFRCSLWATSRRELELVSPEDAALVIMKQGKALAEQLVRDCAKALREAAATIEEVLDR